MYSTSQMDNFYKALSEGHVKQSGVMNYIQHLFIAEHCGEGASVLDICCGRALLLPLLRRYAPRIADYTGVDISHDNLLEAAEAQQYGGGNRPPFPIRFIEGDVTRLTSLVDRKFQVIAYTSALEHMPREEGALSLKEASKVLANDGILFLSTPRTMGPSPRKPQYKVHVYEWDREEVEAVLDECDLEVVSCIGLLPPQEEVVVRSLEVKYGSGASSLYRDLIGHVPAAFLGPVIAAELPEVAKELMFVCSRRAQ